MKAAGLVLALGMLTVPLLAGPLTARNGDFTVGVVDGMTRVMRADPPVEGNRAELYAARGEWEPFQLVVGGSPSVIKEVEIHAGMLHGPGGVTLPAPEVYREHYVTVSEPTMLSPLTKGEYPDALVPQYFPVQPLPALDRVNQPYWIDVFVPYGTPAGEYTGTIEVSTASQGGKTVEFTLHVWDFDLPVTPSMRTSIGTVWRSVAKVHGYDPRAEPPAAPLQNLLNQYYDLLARHRLSVDQIWQSYPVTGGRFDEEKVEAALRYHLLHRHCSTIGVPIWPEWPFVDPLRSDRRRAQKYIASWMEVLRKIRCESRGYVIMGDLDEPNSADSYENVRRWGEFFNEIEPRHGIKVPLLITEQPTPDEAQWGRLDGAPDIWVAHVGDLWKDMEGPAKTRDAARRIAAGDEVWTYTALVQIPEDWERAHGNPKKMTAGHPPVWVIDYPPINHRILAWVMPRLGVTGMAYWDTIYGADRIDVWQDAGSFVSPDGSVYNGDGLLIYPATRKQQGVDAPYASMRLKWIRESVEDYDYFTLATSIAKRNEALAAATTFARGLGDWDDNVPALYEARRRIGEMLSNQENSSRATQTASRQ